MAAAITTDGGCKIAIDGASNDGLWLSYGQVGNRIGGWNIFDEQNRTDSEIHAFIYSVGGGGGIIAPTTSWQA